MFWGTLRYEVRNMKRNWEGMVNEVKGKLWEEGILEVKKRKYFKGRGVINY